MRAIGIILIVIGALMMIFKGFNYTEEKNVADIGPLKINKEQTRHVGWPMYAGGILAVAGIVIIVVPGGKKSD
jgi:drug/metabolite transporter (DMT)-like permease